ncbi:unnamed protein product [Lathyrus sativus]|nr:unnamed protein product [Lathyrus sativus]
MSISELISELRDSFLQRDFDRVEEALIARETRLKAEIEDKKREIRLLNEEIDFQRIEKMSAELELKRLKELIDGGDIACAVPHTGNVGASTVAQIGNVGDSIVASETLMVREATLKSAIEEKVGEIEQIYKFKNWGMLNFEVEVQLIRGEKRGEEFRKVGENDKVLKAVVGKEKCKFGVHDWKACPDGEQDKKDCPNASETLMVREATLKSAIEEKVGEIEQNDQFKNWGKLNFEIDVQIIRDEKRGEEFRKVGENSKVEKGVVGQEKRKFGVHDGNACPFGEHGKKDGPNASGNVIDLVEESLDVKEATTTATIEDKMKEIRLLHEKLAKKEKCATAEVKDEKVDVMAEKKRLGGEPSTNAGLGGSSGNWWTNSSRVVSKNFTTKVAEPAGVIKRDFASPGGYVENVLDGLESDSSSSSSSSSSGEFDISSFTSLKRTKLS